MGKVQSQRSTSADGLKPSQPILVGTPLQVAQKPAGLIDRWVSLLGSVTLHTALAVFLSQSVLRSSSTGTNEQNVVWLTPFFISGDRGSSIKSAEAASIGSEPAEKAEALTSSPPPSENTVPEELESGLEDETDQLEPAAELVVQTAKKMVPKKETSAAPVLSPKQPAAPSPSPKPAPAPALNPAPASVPKPTLMPMASPAPIPKPAPASLPDPVPAPVPAPQNSLSKLQNPEESAIKQSISQPVTSPRQDEQKKMPTLTPAVVSPGLKQLPLPQVANKTEAERISREAAEHELTQKRNEEQKAAAAREAQAQAARYKAQMQVQARELAEQNRAELIRHASEAAEREKLKQEQARQKSVAKEATEARERDARLNEKRLATEKLQQAQLAQQVQTDRKIPTLIIPGKIANLVKVVLPEAKKQPQPPEQRPVFSIPQLKGDLKLIVVGNGPPAINFSFKAVAGKKGTNGRAIRETKIIPIVGTSQENCHEYVIEHVQAGVYTISAESDGISSQANYALRIFENSTKATAKNLGSYTIHKKQVLLKILMPDGVVWDDEKAFTGSMEDSDSITKFNSETGLVWKEYKK